MTNVNIEIPNELHKKVKILCAIEEITLKNFIIKTLKERIKNK